jgi:HK97 family phage portal protein
VTTLRNPANWLAELFGSSGKVKVTARSALETAPFWYGVNRISGNIATLPLNVMRNLNPGAEKDVNHWAHRVLRKRPNVYQTPFVFKQTETARAILWGNSRSYIYRDRTNPELIPLRPDATITGMVDGEKWHCTMPDKDCRLVRFEDFAEQMMGNPQKTVMLPDSDVLHICGFGDGVSGLSLFQVARQSLEVSLGSDKRAANQMTRGFAGKVMLEAPEDSPVFRDQKQAEEFLKDFKEKHGADGSADEIGLLRGGVKANVLQMSNRDAEFIEQRKFQRQEAALWLMLESILGDDESVSYNSEEQKQLAYLKNCLSNWLVRWEEECSYKLLSPTEHFGDSHYIKFNTGSLLRTDTKTTYETLGLGITHRIISPNEARDKIDMNPYEGGDVFENPAISPGTATLETETIDAQATIAHLEHLMKVEEKRVNDMIARGDSHQRIDKWYDGWAARLGDNIEKLGGDRIAAQNHCVQNLEYLKRNPGRELNLNGSAELLARKITNANL